MASETINDIQIDDLNSLSETEHKALLEYYETYQKVRERQGFVDRSSVMQGIIPSYTDTFANEYQWGYILKDMVSGRYLNTITISESNNKILMPVLTSDGKRKCVYTSLMLPQECHDRGIKIYTIRAIPIQFDENDVINIVSDNSTVYRSIDGMFCLPIHELPLVVYGGDELINAIKEQRISELPFWDRVEYRLDQFADGDENMNPLAYLILLFLIIMPTNTAEVERFIFFVAISIFCLLLHGGWILIILLWLYYIIRKVNG